VQVFNLEFGEWDCEIIDVKKRQVKCISRLRENREEKGPVVACSLINPKRFDIFLEKVTELGASEIVPIVSQYSNYRDVNLDKAEQKIIQASEQSQRLSIPVLHRPRGIADFLQEYSSNYRVLVGVERCGNRKLWDVIQEKSAFLIGPEGGFSEEEYSLFDFYENLYKFTLGANVLKSETAAMAFISIWREKFS
jgi:16S rRNA (uracil1498-N3)-methyltransferase